MAKISALDIAGALDGSELLPMVQGLQTRRATFGAFANLVAPLMPAFMKGEPGGNVMSIGLLVAAKQLTIPAGTDMVQTSGHTRQGIGAARYAYDPTVDAAEVLSKPFTCFISKNGRGFRFCENVWHVEHFGAIGNSVIDDAPAIQRGLDAIIATGQPGRLLFGMGGKRYLCLSGLTSSATLCSLDGCAVLDFSQAPAATICLKISGQYTEFVNGYGLKGSITGALTIKGAGNQSVGVDFDSPAAATSTHMLLSGLAITKCGVGMRFTARSYNQLLLKCEIFDCVTALHWPTNANQANDNDERVTLVGCTIYNSGTAIHAQNPSGLFYLFGNSFDYNIVDYFADNGRILSIGNHNESNRWFTAPFKARGDGGWLKMQGGWIVAQNDSHDTTSPYYLPPVEQRVAGRYYPTAPAALVDCQSETITVGGNKVLLMATVELDGVLYHNIKPKLIDDVRPGTWGTGSGRFVMRHMQPSFEYSDAPSRQHASRSRLVNGGFDLDLSKDLLWQFSEATRGRYGAAPSNPASGSDSNIYLRQASGEQFEGSACLRVDKLFGSGSAASFFLMCVPVRFGETAHGSFFLKSASDRPGSNRTLYLRAKWLRLEGYDALNKPIVAHSLPATQVVDPSLGSGTMTIAATDQWTPISSPSPRSQCIAPEWATHWAWEVDLSNAFQASFLFDRAAADVT